MRFIPGDEIVGTLVYATFVGLEPDLSCRVRLNKCDGSFTEELIVATTPEANELVHSLRIGEWVCVHFRDGKSVGIERG